MTDDALKDLVLKHDSEISLLANSIENQSKSIESLVASNAETNKRLEEISGYLAKQALFDNKLEVMDRELSESFKRVHKRIDEMDEIQTSTNGCKSVQLLTKDVESVEKESTHLAGTIGDMKITLETQQKVLDSLPSSKLITWILGFIIVYSVTFGSYVVSELQANEIKVTKIVEHITSKGL